MRLFAPPDIDNLKARSNVKGLSKVLLQYKHAELRREAAEALAAIGGDEAVKALITALEDPDREVRRLAGEGLQRIGKEAAAYLAIHLRHASPETSDTIQRILLRIGEPALDELVLVLQVGDQELREALGRLLVKFGEPAVAPLAKVALDEDRDKGERVAAIRVLGDLGEPAVIPLIAVLKDKWTKEEVRLAAANGLAEIGRPALRPLVELEKQKGLAFEVWAFARHAIDQIVPLSTLKMDSGLAAGLDRFAEHLCSDETAVEERPPAKPTPRPTVHPPERRPPDEAERAQPIREASLVARRQATSWDTVYVFISSTFNDMHAERDYLIKQVFPELREWCERRRLRLVDIDLRWGVKEEDTRNRHVVQVCLDRIDQARPFFLCFLGQRRGWVPRDSDISPATFEAFPALRKYAGQDSVTELEIRHALIEPLHAGMRDPTKPDDRYYQKAEHTFFYLRDDSYLEQLPAHPPQLRQVYTNEGIKDRHERRLADQELEKWREVNIRRASGRPVRDYRATWDPKATSPELLVPLQCPSTDPAILERWRGQWEKAGVTVTGADIEAVPAQAEKAYRFNQQLCSGRLGSFCHEGEPLRRIIVQDLKDAVAARFPEHLEVGETTGLQAELHQQEQFLFEASQGFVDRAGSFEELDAYVDGSAGQILVLTAPAGMGKSTLLAKWIGRYRARTEGRADRSVHFRFAGASDDSTSANALLRSLLQELKEVEHGLDAEIPGDPRALREAWPELLAAAGKQGGLVIVIDALDQLETGLSDLQWLPWCLPQNVRMIVSFARGEQAAEELIGRLRANKQAILSEVKPFVDLEHRRALISRYLSQYLKELDERHLEPLIRSPGAQNPLYLKIVASELRVFGAFANLEDKIRHDFGDSPESAFKGVLARLESDPAYTSITPEQAVPLLFGLLAHARHGLSVDELAALFMRARNADNTESEWDAAADTIHLFLRQVRPFLARRDGRYDFFFHSFRLAALRRYVAEERPASFPQRPATEWHGMLAGYFAGLPTWQPSGVPPGRQPARRKVAELPFHQTKGELWAELEQTLCDLTFIDAKCYSGMLYGLIDDYNVALSAHGLPPALYYGIQEYAKFLHSQSHVLSQVPYLCFQQAANSPKGSVLERPASQLISEGRAPRVWLRWINKPVSAPIHLATLAGHGESVNVCAYSGDSTGILSGSSDGTLKVWDAATGRELRMYTGHPGPVIACAFSPDGRRAVSASVHSMAWRHHNRDDAGDLHLWDAESGMLIALLLDRHWPVTTCAFSRDGRLVIAGLEDGSVHIWDSETARPLFTFSGHVKAVEDCALSPDGTELLTVSNDHIIRRWNLLAGGEISSQGPQLDRTRSRWDIPFAFSQDGTRLVTGIRVGRDVSGTKLAVWDVSSGEQLATLGGHVAAVHACAFSPDGFWVATGSEDGAVKLWQASTGEEMVTLLGHHSRVRCCAFSPDGRYLVSGERDGSLRVWSADIGRLRFGTVERAQDQLEAGFQEALHQGGHEGAQRFLSDLWEGDKEGGLTDHTALIWDCAFSPDSTRLASASKDGSLRIWDVETGNIVAALVGHRGEARACAYSTDGRRIISGGDDGQVKVWDAEDGNQLTTLRAFRVWSSVLSCAVSADGRWLAAGSSDTTIKLWDLESGGEKATLRGHEAGVTTCVFSPDSRRLVSACAMVYGLEEEYDPDVRIWDLETGKSTTLKGGGNVVHDCQFSPDGRQVAAACADSVLRLWSLEHASAPAELSVSRKPVSVYACSYSPDGKRIASASGDGTVRLWDAKTGKKLATVSNHEGPVLTCAFSPGGTLLGSASEDGTVRLWDVTRAGEVGAFWAGRSIGVLAWAAEGHTIAAGDIDGGVYLLRLEGTDAAPPGADSGKPAREPSGRPTEDAESSESQVITPLSELSLDEIATQALLHAVESASRTPLEIPEERSFNRLASLREARCVLTLTGHTDRINDCVFSPDGSLLITASDDMTVKVWDLGTGREIRTLTGARAGVFGCGFSPDGSMILAPIRDKALMRWETATGLQYEALAGCWLKERGEVGQSTHEDFLMYRRRGYPIIAWAHFPRDVWILTTWGFLNEQLRIWSANSGDEIATLEGHEGRVANCTFSPDFSLVASVSDDHSIRVWETEQWKQVARFSGDPEFQQSCTFSSDGQRLAAGIQAYPHLIMNIWDIRSGSVLATLADEAQAFLTDCAFSPDGCQVAAASSDDRIRVWNVGSGEIVASIDLCAENLCRCIYSPDGRRVVSASMSKEAPCRGLVRVWELG